jgi:ankyrin repeat protein
MLGNDLSIDEQIRNDYQAQLDQLDRIVYLMGQTEQEALQIITPLDQEQKQLDRQTEVMNLQHEILGQAAKRYTDLSQPETFIQLNRTYQERLAILQQNFTQDYENFLKQRKHYFDFDQNQIIPLEGAPRSMLLEQFQQTLATEMPVYQAFELTAGTYAIWELKSLEAEIQRHIERYEALDRQKILTLETARERRDFLDERQQQLQQTQQNLLTKPHWNFLKACEQGDLPQVEALVTAQRKAAHTFINQTGLAGRTALHLACGNGHFTVVNYLLQHGANPLLPDSIGYLPWHYAAVKRQSCTTTIFEVLGQYIKKVNSKENDTVNAVGPYGRTALHTAALFGNQAAVKWLLEQGANVNAAEQGAAQRTPLHNAAFKGHVEVVRTLLEHKANPFALNANQETPLFEALFYGQETVARIFHDQRLWLTPSEQKQLQTYLTDRPALRQCLKRLLQPEIELHAKVVALESAHHLVHPSTSQVTVAAQLSTRLTHLWADTASAIPAKPPQVPTSTPELEIPSQATP